jgi:hypothetical protein
MRSFCSFLMLQEVLENDDFLHVSSARRLVNISKIVRATDLKFKQVKYMGLHVPIVGSTVVPSLPWWQKLELNDYLRNPVSN